MPADGPAGGQEGKAPAARGKAASWPSLSLDGDARSLPAHSPQRPAMAQGPGLPLRTLRAARPRSGSERPAPAQVCRCCRSLDTSACCRKSAPPYLEPCSVGGKQHKRLRYHGAGSIPATTSREYGRACMGLRDRRGEITSSLPQREAGRGSNGLGNPTLWGQLCLCPCHQLVAQRKFNSVLASSASLGT